MSICLLAVETSCDETAAALIKNGVLKSNVVATQAIHKAYGGVVPELASRAHQKNIVLVVDKALKDASISKETLSGIAFTQGPGLLGALLVGCSFAKAMALSLQIPLLAVNHIKAHILSHFIESPQPNFPFICLTVSGGHTQLVLVKSPLAMTLIGQTRDDAVGEAFDKTAKIIGLPYPGGPLIDKYASMGNPHAFAFPKVNMPGLDFSFSGIKTAFLYFLQQRQKIDPTFIQNNLPDICASVQHTLVNILIQKLKKAMLLYNIKEVGIAGGVAANTYLRQTLAQVGETLGWKTYIPNIAYCTDNAAMIAMAAYFLYEASIFSPQSIVPNPRMKL